MCDELCVGRRGVLWSVTMTVGVKGVLHEMQVITS